MPIKVFAGLGSVEVDPWGFVLPFGLWVWVALLAFLLLLSVGSCFLSFRFSEKDFSDEGFAFVSITLRQSVWVDEGGWWWQRVVLGLWMLMTMVLTRSYEGNLMSLLAVRHLPQPYQTLRDVVDDPSVVMVWEKQGAPIQAVIDATSGIFYEVKKSEEQGRVKALPMYTFPAILEEVISKQKVILDYELVLTVLRSNHFSRTGRCDLYLGQERIVAHPLSLIGQKDSPLVLALSTWVISMTEAGLYVHWNSATIPNSSACNQVPTKITISSSLSFRQCWWLASVTLV
ncbi:ionotropic receptor 93a-like [Scylla paramamosain]|uniref:ionotropic receptor 93a-like n=1 Tax=Scylla paramamosain TaxID=85552 RepID=UPI003083B0F2